MSGDYYPSPMHGSELRRLGSVRLPRLHGLAVPFGDHADRPGRRRIIFDRQAFDDLLQREPVAVMCINHDPGIEVGSGQLSVDWRGLHVDVELADTPNSRDLIGSTESLPNRRRFCVRLPIRGSSRLSRCSEPRRTACAVEQVDTLHEISFVSDPGFRRTFVELTGETIPSRPNGLPARAGDFYRLHAFLNRAAAA